MDFSFSLCHSLTKKKRKGEREDVYCDCSRLLVYVRRTECTSVQLYVQGECVEERMRAACVSVYTRRNILSGCVSFDAGMILLVSFLGKR